MRDATTPWLRSPRARQLLVATLWTCAAGASLLAVGTFVWQAPIIGLIGSLGGYLPGWLIVIAVLGIAAGASAWLLRRQRRLIVGTLLCTLCAVGGGVIISDQTRTLSDAGIQAQFTDFFGPFLVDADGPDQILDYGPPGDDATRMGVYLPEASHGQAPVVVHVHGGGFVAGSLTDDAAFARYLTERGYVVFTPDYLLATEETPTWDIAPAQVACALETVNTVAPDYGGDPTRLFVTGSSAGGNLAPLVANAIESGSDFGADCGEMPDISAVSINIAATDPGVAEGTPYALSGDLARYFVETYTGGTPEEVPHRYAAVNANEFLTGDSPPTLLVYGENDWLVSSQASLSFAQRARSLDVEIEAIGVPWTGHLIGLSGAGGRVIAESTARWFAQHEN